MPCQWFVQYRWIEDCLKDGKLLSCEPYVLAVANTSVSSVATQCEDVQEQLATPPSSRQLTVNAGVEGIPKSEPVAGSDVVISGPKDFMPKQMNAGEIRKIDFSDEDDELDFHDESNSRDGAVHEPNDLNAHITRILREMWHIYEDVFGDEWRALTYKKVLDGLEFFLS